MLENEFFGGKEETTHILWVVFLWAGRWWVGLGKLEWKGDCEVDNVWEVEAVDRMEVMSWIGRVKVGFDFDLR